MGIGKSPGSDVLTSEFYKRFWDKIGEDVVKSIKNVFDKGELSISQKRGIITLLPKKDKFTDVLNNLLPVTLLNVDYKIATKVIANRLAKVLPDTISPNQTGYVKNRYIGENVRLISDVIDYTKANIWHCPFPPLTLRKLSIQSNGSTCTKSWMFSTSSKISKDGLKCVTRIFLVVLQTMVLHPPFSTLNAE